MSREEQPPRSVEELDEFLSRPSPRLVDMFRRLPGDILFLGVGGKMGPTMARMASRAAQEAGTPRRILGASRFSSPNLRQQLEGWAVTTISADLLNENQVASLPEAPHIVCMTGMKFGASQAPAMTWAMNCQVPAIVCQRFRRSRITAFSSGNVYGLTPVASGGSKETDVPRPVGEYAWTVLGRERMYEYFSDRHQLPTSILRLNYSTELRYGVLVDLALRVWNRDPVPLEMGYVNVIWQRDANELGLLALEHVATPPRILNIAGADILRIRDVCERFGRLLKRSVVFEGEERADALLNNATASYKILGRPLMPTDRMLEWTAQWVRTGGPLLGKPTHFESREGKF